MGSMATLVTHAGGGEYMNNKNWKDIPGYIGIFKASSDGEIFNIRSGRLLSQRILSNGYHAVTLYTKEVGKHGKTEKVCRLVAKAFLPNSNDYPQVNHIDGNKLNDTVENLEWCTNKQNGRHAQATGLFTNKKRLSPEQVIEMRKEREVKNTSMAKLAQRYHVSYNTIKRALLKIYWKNV